MIREAASAGAQLIATPEMTHLLQRRPKLFWPEVKSPEDDPVISAFGALAKELSVTLIIGSIALKGDDERAVNRSLLYTPDGVLTAQYDKIHLFDVVLGKGNVWRESAIYAPGQNAVVADTPAGKIGMSVCYDLRFPYLYRQLAKAGAQILAVPAAFTVPTGQAHWHVLLRARAIETGCFVIAPAQGGEHEDGRTTYGHSLMVGPWGDIIAELAHDEPGILYADIDLADVEATRAKVPSLSHDREFAAP